MMSIPARSMSRIAVSAASSIASSRSAGPNSPASCALTEANHQPGLPWEPTTVVGICARSAMARVLRSVGGGGGIGRGAVGDVVEGEGRRDLGRVAERVEDRAIALSGREQTPGPLRITTAHDDVGPDLELLDADLRRAVEGERPAEVGGPGHGHPDVVQ